MTPTGLTERDFLRLFVKHEPALRAYARTLLPDFHAVDDALQEGSITMWQKIAQLNGEDDFLPWAKVIVRFKCLNACSRMRRDRHVFSEQVLALLAEEAAQTTFEEHSAARTAVRDCLELLPTGHRELVLARYGDPGELQRLAKGVGRSDNAIYKLLGRLREKLAECVRRKLVEPA